MADKKRKHTEEETIVTEWHHFDHEIKPLSKKEKREDSTKKGDEETQRLEKDEVVDYSQIKFSAVEVADYNSLPTFPIRPHFNSDHIGMKLETQIVAFDGCPNDPYHPASMPLYQTATFVQPSATQFGPYDYTRSGNPTRTALETLVAGLENGYAAFAFSTGMAALTTVTRLLKTGDEILSASDLYGGTYRLFTKVSAAKHGLKVSFVDTTNLSEIKKAITPQTKLFHMESPSNPLIRISDIAAIAELLHEHKILFSIDSTMMSPILCRPLSLGADLVVHSGTKFFGGHSDMSCGLVIVKDQNLAKEIGFFQNAEGTGLAPFECWLALRGIKTLALRVEKQQSNAEKVAAFLTRQKKIQEVRYAGLEPNPQANWKGRDRSYEEAVHEFGLHKRQAKGGGCVLSFTTGNVEFSRNFVNALRLFKITVSFGSVNSLVELPCLLSHASIPKDQRTLPEDLVRMSIGIEHIDDILADIQQALAKAETTL